MPCKILIVDDHPMFRDGLRLRLERQADWQVVAEAGDGKSALEAARSSRPDVVLMDLHLPDQNGLETARAILSAQPSVRVLILSGDPEPDNVREALKAGASGFLLKLSAAEELVRAIQSALAGQTYLCPESITTMVRTHQLQAAGQLEPKRALSERERQLLQFIAQGRRSKEIAQFFNVTAKSAEGTRSRLMKRLGCRSTAELVRYAIREKLLQA